MFLQHISVLLLRRYVVRVKGSFVILRRILFLARDLISLVVKVVENVIKVIIRRVSLERLIKRAAVVVVVVVAVAAVIVVVVITAAVVIVVINTVVFILIVAVVAVGLIVVAGATAVEAESSPVFILLKRLKHHIVLIFNINIKLINTAQGKVITLRNNLIKS